MCPNVLSGFKILNSTYTLLMVQTIYKQAAEPRIWMLGYYAILIIFFIMLFNGKMPFVQI